MSQTGIAKHMWVSEWEQPAANPHQILALVCWTNRTCHDNGMGLLWLCVGVLLPCVERNRPTGQANHFTSIAIRSGGTAWTIN